MNPTVKPIPPDQISPKAVILKVFELGRTLRRYWKLIAGLVLIGGIGGFAYDFTNKKKPTYTADIVFNLGGGSSSSGFGDMGALAGMFGLSGGAPDANIFVGENFLYYAISRPIMEKALMKEKQLMGRKDLLVNHYIQYSGIRDEDWEDMDSLRAYRFNPKDPRTFTKKESSIMGMIYARLQGETSVFQPDRKSSFMTLRAGTQSELLSKLWAETLLETIEEDYRVKQSKKTMEMYTLLRYRADSLARRLNRTETDLARYMDQNQQVVVAEGHIMETKLSRNSTFLQGQYVAALQAVENLRLNMIKEAPLFTIIEPVVLPLEIEIHKTYGLQIGIVLALLISILIVFFRETYRSIMRQ